jgi:hypothetical protein
MGILPKAASRNASERSDLSIETCGTLAQSQPRTKEKDMNATAEQLITAAIAAAGRGPAVARAFGLAENTVTKWGRQGKMPAHWIYDLCRMGNNTVQPAAILEAMARGN